MIGSFDGERLWELALDIFKLIRSWLMTMSWWEKVFVGTWTVPNSKIWSGISPACSGFSFFLKCQVLQIALISSLSYQLLVAIILHQVPAHVNYWYKVRYGPETTCWRSMETAPTTHPKAPQIGREKEWNWKNMSGGLVVDANLVIHLSTPRGISTTPNSKSSTTCEGDTTWKNGYISMFCW